MVDTMSFGGAVAISRRCNHRPPGTWNGSCARRPQARMRVNVWLPDELNATIKRELPDVNVSAVLQRSLAALLECRHDELACSACASPIDRRQLIDNALSAFYLDLHWKLCELVDRGGTAEAAARIAKDIACRHHVG